MEPRLQPEVQQESNFKVGCTEIVEELAFGHGGKLRTRFRLDDNLVIHDHVDALHGEGLLLVRDVNAEFSRYAVTTLDQLTLEGHYVDVLEKAESERVVYLEERADDGMRTALLRKMNSGHCETILEAETTKSPNRRGKDQEFSRKYPPDRLHPPHPHVL